MQMYIFWIGVATFLGLWVILPIVERNEGFYNLDLTIWMGWAAYILFAAKCALEVVGEDLACGPERRQAIIAILIFGGLLPAVTRLESWKFLSESNIIFAFANSGLALLSIGLLQFAYILLLRTPRRDAEPSTDRGD